MRECFSWGGGSVVVGCHLESTAGLDGAGCLAYSLRDQYKSSSPLKLFTLLPVDDEMVLLIDLSIPIGRPCSVGRGWAAG